MNKLFLKVGAIVLGAGLVVGSGVAIAAHRESFKAASAAEVVAYTLDGTDAQTDDSDHKASGYATSYALTQDGVSWEVYGNTTMNPWRIGGKSLTNVDRTVYSKSAVSSENISKVELTVGTASSITVNSLSLVVSTAQDGGGTVTSTVTETFAASSKITFARPNAADWSNKFFKFIFNVTVSSTSNKFVQFKNADFIYTVETVAPDTVTISGANAVTVGNTVTLSASATKSGSATGVNQNVVWSSSDETKARVSQSGVVTGIGNGSATIRATSEDDNTVYGEKVITVSGGKTTNTALIVVPTNVPAAYGDSYVTVDGVYLHAKQIMKNGEKIQIQKDNGLFENVIALPQQISTIELSMNESNESDMEGWTLSVSADGTSFTTLSSTEVYTNKLTFTPASGNYFFKITGPTKKTLYLDSILVGLGNSAETAMNSLAASLNDMLDVDCKGESDTSNITSARWAEIEAAYTAGDASAKSALADVDSLSYHEVNYFLERYDYIVSTFSYSNFLNRTISSNTTINVLGGGNNVALIVIVASSLAVLSAVALVFVLKKKKHN